jgi:hypothetical protein
MNDDRAGAARICLVGDQSVTNGKRGPLRTFTVPNSPSIVPYAHLAIRGESASLPAGAG